MNESVRVTIYGVSLVLTGTVGVYIVVHSHWENKLPSVTEASALVFCVLGFVTLCQWLERK